VQLIVNISASPFHSWMRDPAEGATGGAARKMEDVRHRAHGTRNPTAPTVVAFCKTGRAGQDEAAGSSTGNSLVIDADGTVASRLWRPAPSERGSGSSSTHSIRGGRGSRRRLPLRGRPVSSAADRGQTSANRHDDSCRHAGHRHEQRPEALEGQPRFGKTFIADGKLEQNLRVPLEARRCRTRGRKEERGCTGGRRRPV